MGKMDDGMTAGERPLTVLVTCFEPFDGQAINASRAAVDVLTERWADGTPGWTGQRPAELVTVVLPVTFRGARQTLRTAVAAHRPDLVLCVGEAGGRSAVGLERLAVNVIDARIPDNDGSAPVDVPVIAGAPAAFFSTLPLRASAEAVARAGVPVEVSNTAGTFVCNATFYALMHLLETTPEVVGGFVHVPRTPEQVGAGEPSLARAQTARGLEAILGVLTGAGGTAGDSHGDPGARLVTGKES